MSTLTVKVVKKTIEAEDIVSFELHPLDESPLPAFEAGAHIDVHIPNGMIRQYSLCHHPKERQYYRIAVLRDPVSRGGSIAMHDMLAQGATLEISAPKNHFPLVGHTPSLLFAGGIGITPILSMAHTLADDGVAFALYYCGRALSRMAFREEFAQASYQENVFIHADDGIDEQKLDILQVLSTTPTDTPIYVCGPTGFIDFVIRSAKEAGWSDAHVHREYFGAAVAVTAEGGDTAFDIVLASSGVRYHIPKDKTIVQVLSEQQIEIPFSCEQGVCGTCITRVIEGIPDHRDLYFSDEEHALNDQMTPCCSRAKSPLLILDL